jgi:hypothetical protein
MKEIYENKIRSLNNKISTDEEMIQELKQQLKIKNEVIFIS